MRYVRIATVGFTLLATSSMLSAFAQHTEPYDMQFIDMMIHHHQDGVKMAAIEESQGDRADVRAFAQRTAQGQKKDLEDLQAIRDRLFKGHPVAHNARIAGMSMQLMMQKGKQDIAKLEKAVDATDEVFLQLMASHHQDALRMTRDGMKRARDPELRKLAAKMNAMQTKELDEITHLRAMVK
jgi:uncharacterized protein (DUF305 family)